MKKALNIIVIISFLIFLESCGLAAKKMIYTALGGTGKVQWIKPFKPIREYESIVFTSTKNDIGELLPNSIKSLVLPAIKSTLTEEMDTPRKEILFRENAEKDQLQVDTKIIFFNQKADARILVIRAKIHDPNTGELFGLLNIVSEVEGARSNKEILDGLRNGIVTAVKEMKAIASDSR